MSNTQHRVPGDRDFWLFIAIDAAMFSVIIVVLSYFKTIQPEAYQENGQLLSSGFGMMNTLILLTSSLFVAKGVLNSRLQQLEIARQHFRIAMMFGGAFVAIKSLEYYDLLSQGHTYSNSTFLSYYFSFTGLHLFHVVIGLVGLWLSIQWHCSNSECSEENVRFIESAGIYWHLVDAIWVFLFLLLYLT